MRITFFTVKIPWFGKHSGYECLVNYFPNDLKLKKILLFRDNFSLKLIGMLLKVSFQIESVRSDSLANAIKHYLIFRKKKIVHFLYFEETTLAILKLLPKKCLNNTITTFHIPPSQWKNESLSELQKLKHAIVLYEKDLDWFRKKLPRCNFYLIRHGIDINFFSPGLEVRDTSKLLFVGHYLRDFDLLLKIVSKIFITSPEMSLHLVIPEMFRTSEILIRLNSEFPEKIYFYANLSDEALRALYRECGFLLLPMLDSGANTAIVQGLATGIPIVTNDVGGIRSYGGGDIFPVFKKKEVNEMISYISELKNNHLAYAKLCRNIRDFAIRNLDWNIVAKLHLEVYNKMLITSAK